jgi:energy-coupling factor transport system ATP-binding protein
VIRLNGFGWRHAGRRAWAVRGVDLRIERGERVLLLGPSGAGKSTLLAALAGLLAHDSGEAEGELMVDGRVGIVFQDPQSQLVMSRCGDEVAFGLENLGWPAGKIWPRVDEVLRQVGFGYPRAHSTERLSGGEQQRLVLAGALAPQADLLLLDEPTANLDPAGAAQVVDTLGRLPRECTMVLVEHRIEPVLALIDRVVVLAPGGGVRADGTAAILSGSLGAELASSGVWVPGHPMPARRATQPPGDTVIAATGLLARGLSYPDIAVHRGEVLAVVGPNGSGKSTLAAMLGGLLRPEAGNVTSGWGERPHRWAAKSLARRIGSVFQNPEHQFVSSTVQGELALGGTTARRVDELLQRLRLEPLARANPFTLSGGEARRLSVASALAAGPPVLLLDEPTFGQDRRTWIELVNLLADLRDEGHALVAVTHDPEVVAVLADRQLALEGR